MHFSLQIICVETICIAVINAKSYEMVSIFRDSLIKITGVKQCRLKSLPEVLCIHLKRFRHDTAYNAKINTRIKFQLRDLDLQPYMEVDEEGNTQKKEGQSYMYDLISLVSHRGSSVDCKFFQLTTN